MKVDDLRFMVKKESRPSWGTYCTNQPCSICARMIINAGIKKIYYQSGYADSLAKELLAEAGIEIIQINSDNRGEGS